MNQVFRFQLLQGWPSGRIWPLLGWARLSTEIGEKTLYSREDLGHRILRMKGEKQNDLETEV